jgi:hypothetical protein
LSSCAAIFLNLGERRTERRREKERVGREFLKYPTFYLSYIEYLIV